MAAVVDALDWVSGDDGARDGKSETGPHVGFLFPASTTWWPAAAALAAS